MRIAYLLQYLRFVTLLLKLSLPSPAWAEGTVLSWFVCVCVCVCVYVCLSVCLLPQNCCLSSIISKSEHATALNLCKELAILLFYKTG